MPERFDPYHKWLGIPPKQQPPHHYRLLGIDFFESDHDVIEAAADRLMAYLKDCGTGKHSVASQELLNKVSAARVCLLDDAKKAQYDNALRSLLAKQAQQQSSKTIPIAEREPIMDITVFTSVG